MLTIDEEGISTYEIDEPMIAIYPTNPASEGKEFKFTINALSRNEYTGHNLICSFALKFMVVPIESLALWPTGLNTPSSYYANYPG